MRSLKISIQSEDFSVDEECALLRAGNRDIGALATFSGLVREMDEAVESVESEQREEREEKVSSLFLEHYPGMTEKSLRKIAEAADQRWPLLDITIIHRIGELQVGEQIVLVVVSSMHRQAAFAACSFIMDFLKTQAPFWKKSRSRDSEHWVEAKQSDSQAVERWAERGEKR